jgi:hypothetical protein
MGAMTKAYKNFWSENLKGSDHSEDLGVDIWETGWEGVDWTHLAQDRDKWQAVVNTVMNLRVP